LSFEGGKEKVMIQWLNTNQGFVMVILRDQMALDEKKILLSMPEELKKLDKKQKKKTC